MKKRIPENELKREDLTLFRELMNRSNDILSIIDMDTGLYLYVNEMTCKSTGYTREEFLGMTVADIDPTIAQRWDADKEHRRRRKKTVFAREGMIRRKDGTCFPVEISSSIVRMAGGEYMVATARDISERTTTLEALSTERDRLERGIEERTAKLAKANESLKAEIAIRSIIGKALRATKRQLQRQKSALERKNVALSEIVKQIEWEKKKVINGVMIDANELLFPLLDRMKIEGASANHIKLLKDNLNKLTSKFGRTISNNDMEPTPRQN